MVVPTALPEPAKQTALLVPHSGAPGRLASVLWEGELGYTPSPLQKGALPYVSVIKQEAHVAKGTR